MQPAQLPDAAALSAAATGISSSLAQFDAAITELTRGWSGLAGSYSAPEDEMVLAAFSRLGAMRDDLVTLAGTPAARWRITRESSRSSRRGAQRSWRTSPLSSRRRSTPRRPRPCPPGAGPHLLEAWTRPWTAYDIRTRQGLLPLVALDDGRWWRRRSVDGGEHLVPMPAASVFDAVHAVVVDALLSA